jgi:hypothetical protein
MSLFYFMNPKQHIQLIVGDIRQPGDEVLRTAEKAGYDLCGDNYSGYLDWLPVRLLGHPILPTDLISSSFRRPLA